MLRLFGEKSLAGSEPLLTYYWPAPNIWVFIAQLVEHCSANAEAVGSNPVEAQNFFRA